MHKFLVDNYVRLTFQFYVNNFCICAEQVLTYSEKIERMKSTINRLRDERSNIHNENNKKLFVFYLFYLKHTF